MRRAVLSEQTKQIGTDIPFSLESSLHYRRTKILYDRGELPEIDRGIQYPEGIKISEIDSIASEPVYARLAHLFPDEVDFHERMRWIEAGWFSLSFPLLMIALRVWTGSWLAGFFAALLYGVSLSSVLRSTGQEISRENFAMPLLITAQIFAAAFFKRPSSSRGTFYAILSAVFMALSLIAWDMIQYVIAVWTLGVSLHIVSRGRGQDTSILKYFVFLTAAIIAAGLLHPYYQFHGLVFSPLVIWMVSVIVCSVFIDRYYSESVWSCSLFELRDKKTWAKRWVSPVLILLIPAFAVSLAGSVYGESYEHFMELLAAKIRFLNVKPSDPSVMTFYQRIMWVPSLHSASWLLTKWLFPLTLWLCCFIGIAAWRLTRRESDPLIRHWVLLFFIALLTYVLFVRFHVFVSLSCAVLCGWLYGFSARKGGALRFVLAGVLMVAVVTEGAHTFRERAVMGRPNVYYEELRELSDWLEEHVAPEAVLGNMGVSAYAAAYGKCAIVIHPKFEDPSIRERLEHFGNLMFGGDEKDLRDWMLELDVNYLIYSYGEFASQSPEYQMRYFVNRMNPPAMVPARRFERDDDSLHYFNQLWKNRKYAVYEVFSKEDELRADAFARDSVSAFESGRLQHAEALALKALSIAPWQEDALRIMRHVGSLHEQGFRVTEELE